MRQIFHLFLLVKVQCTRNLPCVFGLDNQNAIYVAGASLGKCIYVPTGGACCLVEVSTETLLHVNEYKNIIFTGH